MGLYAGATGDEEPSLDDECCDAAAVGCSDGGLGGLIVKGMGCVDCALWSDLPVLNARFSLYGALAESRRGNGFAERACVVFGFGG